MYESFKRENKNKSLYRSAHVVFTSKQQHMMDDISVSYDRFKRHGLVPFCMWNLFNSDTY